MYMLQAGQIGGLAVSYAFAQYKEVIGRIFGSEYNFMEQKYKTIKDSRNIRHEEEIAAGIYNFIPESILLKDVYAGNWLALMRTSTKQMLEKQEVSMQVANRARGTTKR